MNKNGLSKIKVLYLHDRPSGGAGESLFQIINGNQHWKTEGVVFLNQGFLKEKFAQLIPFLSISYIENSSWLSSARGKKWLFWPTKIIHFSKNIFFYKQITSIVDEKRIDIIHTNTVKIIEGGIVAKKKKIPHFIQIRELMDLDYYSYPLPKKWIIKKISQYSDILIANSKRTKEGLLKLGADESKVRVIYNAVAPAKETIDIRMHLQLAEDTKIVAIVGWITPIKVIENFLKVAYALRNKKDVKFLVIGSYGFSKSYNEKIKNSIANLPNTIHSGLIPNVTAFMGSFDLLLSMGEESFGRTVAEALVAGTPAIGVRSSGVAELIQHEKSGYVVDKSDIASFVKYTEQLLDDTLLNNQMGQFGMEDVKKRFSLKTIRNQYLELYQEFIK